MTITLNNRYVFDDLRQLGASPAFLKREVRSQAGSVFRIPSLVGMGAMYFLYILLMYGNDGKITASEAGGLAVCLFILMGIGLIYYAVYRLAVKNMCHQIQG